MALTAKKGEKGLRGIHRRRAPGKNPVPFSPDDLGYSARSTNFFLPLLFSSLRLPSLFSPVILLHLIAVLRPLADGEKIHMIKRKRLDFSEVTVLRCLLIFITVRIDVKYRIPECISQGTFQFL